MATGIIAVESLPALHSLDIPSPPSQIVRRSSDNSSSGVSSDGALSSQAPSPDSRNPSSYAYTNEAIMLDKDDDKFGPKTLPPLKRRPLTGVLSVKDEFPLPLSVSVSPSSTLSRLMSKEESRPGLSSRLRSFFTCKCSSFTSVMPSLDEPQDIDRKQRPSSNNNNSPPGPSPSPPIVTKVEQGGTVEEKKKPLISLFYVYLFLLLIIFALTAISIYNYYVSLRIYKHNSHLLTNKTGDAFRAHNSTKS